MKKADNFNASKWLVENKITFQSRLNENKIQGVDIDIDDDMITLSGDSGDYDGFVEDNGTVSFSVTNDEEEFNNQNWKDILGDDHVFVKVANAIPTEVEALDDYLMITVKASDLTGANEPRLDENNNQKPNFSSDAKTNFPELVKKYGTKVVDALENSYENFIDMYSSPVKVNIKYKKSIENYKNNPKDLEDLIQMAVN